MNPLWIISLFLGTAELIAGIVATQLSGWVQGMLAIFTVAFPVSVAAAFFGILLRKPYVLYAPADFPRHTPVTAFVEAMSTPSRIETRVIETMVKAALEATAEPTPPDASKQSAGRSAAIGDALASAREEIERSVVHVHLDDFRQGALGWVAVQIFEDSTVADLLNRTWFYISDDVPPYTYGEIWELVRVDADAGTVRLGSHFSNSRKDDRLLGEVGIHKGDRLAVRFLDRRDAP